RADHRLGSQRVGQRAPTAGGAGGSQRHGDQRSGGEHHRRGRGQLREPGLRELRG
ncbi:unnamed protein product, partial [Effrenium voratum]